MHRLIYFFILPVLLLCNLGTCYAQKIDRKAIAERHKVVINAVDTLGSLTVGNGKFAFTVDATGLQSFPQYYANGIPLGTESEWGWHSFPNKEHYQYSETLAGFDFNNDGKKALYAVQLKTGRGKAAGDYFRANPHRLQLGNIGLAIIKKDGSEVIPGDMQDVHQELNVWTGLITSNFKIEGIPVRVITCADANRDAIAFKVISPLLKKGRIRVKIRFPSPTGDFADMGTNYQSFPAGQTTTTKASPHSTLFTRKLDSTTYYAYANWEGSAIMNLVKENNYELTPKGDSDTLSMSVEFSPVKLVGQSPSFNQVEQSSQAGWKNFWLSGGAVDFSGSTDDRAFELERRIILSEYLTRVQCAGNSPPQETGLTYNSWYGRPHLEMYWWHAAHYALWGRTPLLEKSMQWYFKAYNGAKLIAQRQGYQGARWQKMTDNDGGETPSNVGSFLVWQQPHIIYLAELIYRDKPSNVALNRYKSLVFATADFMASFAHLDKTTGYYNLGKGVIPAQERFDPAQTYNPPYELAYWKWALQVAQNWRKRLGMIPNRQWQTVIDHLAPLPQINGLYNAAQNVEDPYGPGSKYITDHPAVLAALSTLPANSYVDTAIMHKTYNRVMQVWHWEHTWGWDFPMVAMTATRLRQPDEALSALFKNVTTNTYLVNGHNYQDKRLTLYLPGNGGLLAAIAMMCAGFDGDKTVNPGFPKNGKWKVKWEGLKKLP